MILFSNKLSPRLTYIAEFIAKELLQNTVRITIDPEEFKSFPGPRINYSERSITNDEIRVHPHELLFEPGIQEQKIDCFDFDGSRAFFRTSGDIPFDLFAACFY